MWIQTHGYRWEIHRKSDDHTHNCETAETSVPELSLLNNLLTQLMSFAGVSVVVQNVAKTQVSFLNI